MDRGAGGFGRGDGLCGGVLRLEEWEVMDSKSYAMGKFCECDSDDVGRHERINRGGGA